MAIDTLHEKFVYHLQEMYYVENRLVDVLDDMATDAATDELRDGFERHREQTRQHVRRLEEVFDAIDEPPDDRPSQTFDALLEERQRLFDQTTDEEGMRDLHDLGVAVKNEHLEIAGYENLVLFARKLDLSRDVRKALDENLGDEKQTKKQLKAMADDSTVRKIFARLAG